jgi:L-2-hydroxyglutarate oxidase LhgO
VPLSVAVFPNGQLDFTPRLPRNSGSAVVDRIDCVVIGAGVVGLACARALARGGREVLVLERHGQIGTETSSRNSEVIHAGIYYDPGTLKARLCVVGRAQLYQHCEAFGVPFRRCGKIIVATDESQFDTLRGYQRRSIANGVGELRWLSPAEVAELEPAVRCVGAVLSESTGIIDSHAYMESLVGDLEAHGGVVAFHTQVLAGRAEHGRLILETDQGPLDAAFVVNAAGLAAPDVARRLAPHAADSVPAAYYAKGHYYTLSGAAPFHRLVYPVAEAGGLGVHVTLDLAGQARFGPDVVWIDAPDYSFDARNRDRFVSAIRRYYPDLDEARLQPGYTGIRPKISAPDQPAADFRIQGPDTHGVAGLVNLFGIESPGLTASLALADLVRAYAAGAR